jgi:hypothetical protein
MMNRFPGIPKLFTPPQAAQIFHTTEQRLAELAKRKRGARARRTGQLVKLTRYFLPVRGGKQYLYSERELRRAKRAGVLSAAGRAG